MARDVTLFTGQWADLPFEKMCELASGWGYDGLEIACWGDHFEVDRALNEPGYIEARHAILKKYNWVHKYKRKSLPASRWKRD